MHDGTHHTRRAVLWLLLFLPPTVWFGMRQLALPVDATNAAMKAIGTREAADVARLQAGFGAEHTVLLAFLAAPHVEVRQPERERIAELRERLQAEPGVARVEPTVEPDPSALLLVVRLRDAEPATSAAALAVAGELCPATLQLVASGQPLAMSAIAAAVAAERMRMVPLLFGVMLGLGLLVYRSLHLAVAMVLPAVVAILWTGGLFAVLGHRLDPVAVLLEPVLLTVGVATSVRFVEQFRMAQLRGHGQRSAAARVVRDLQRPALLTVVATVVGFWSLATNAIPAVADFGFYAGLGSALANTLTFLLLPAWLQLGSDRAVLGKSRADAPTHPVAARTAALLDRRRHVVLGVTCALLVLAAAGLPRLWIDNDPMQVLRQDDPFRRDFDRLAARFGAVEVFDVLVPSDSPGQAPERLLPFLGARATQPPAAGPAGPALRARSGDVVVPVRLVPGGSQQREALFAMLERDAGLLGLDGVRPAGALVQIARDSGRLVRGQLAGIATALGSLFLCMLIGFRSWRAALLGILPNAVPGLLLYGALGLVGRPLSVATVMIGSVMLGLIIDNTIYFLHHYGLGRRSLPPRAAVARALAAIGRPMWLSSAVLAAGFGACLTGNMASTVEFGGLAATTIVLGLLATAVVLPAVLCCRRHGAPSERMACDAT